jgi:hypothetical protein
VPDFRTAAVGYPWFKAVVFALLALNTAVFVTYGTSSAALDSLAWLTLLFSFELETGRREWFRGRWSTIALHGARLLAGAALAAAAVGYVRGKEWLDAINVGLWIGVVAMLEFEVRRRDIAMRHRGGLVAATIVLYAGLAGLVLAWLLRGEWFDAYDAALWLVAFATLEMDLLGRFRNDRPAT